MRGWVHACVRAYVHTTKYYYCQLRKCATMYSFILLVLQLVLQRQLLLHSTAFYMNNHIAYYWGAINKYYCDVCIPYYCNILLLHTSAYYQILLQYYLQHTPTYNCMLLHTAAHYQILLLLLLLLLQLQLQQLLLFQTTTNCKQLAASNTTGLCIYVQLFV